MTGEEEALALSRLDSLEHRVEGLERGRERQHEILKEMERTLGTLPRRVGKLEADELQPQITKLFEITNEHWDRMEGGDEAHRDLMARVARCEARLDGRGHEVARDLTPAEAMDEIADLIRDEKPPHPSDWSQYNEWLAAQADPAPASPRDSDLMDMDPDTPGRWTPASPEDTEGLEVVAARIYGDGTWHYRTAPKPPGSLGVGEHLVRLFDAVGRIREARASAAATLYLELPFQSEVVANLTARLEKAERERDALRQRLEGMVVTRDMVSRVLHDAVGLSMGPLFCGRLADRITRALHAQEADDE